MADSRVVADSLMEVLLLVHLPRKVPKLGTVDFNDHRWEHAEDHAVSKGSLDQSTHDPVRVLIKVKQTDCSKQNNKNKCRYSIP